MSTAIVKITPLSGCRQEDSQPRCYLLEIDQARILLDCGASPDSFSVDHLEGLFGKGARPIDLILLSHGDMEHCGGLPHVLARLAEGSSTCAVLATVPVHHLGIVAMYDAYQSFEQAHGHAPPSTTLDQIDSAFDRITMLRYLQPFTCMTGNAAGIHVTPIAAGHSLGGAMWRIRKHSEEIYYAIDFNHRKDMHIDGAALDVIQRRPSLFIGDAQGALDVVPGRRDRDMALVEHVHATTKAGGSLLLPTDSAARVLELLQVLEAHSRAAASSSSDAKPFQIVLASHQSRRVIDLARGMLEWLSPSLAKVFEIDRSNPFDFQHVRICHTVEQVTAIDGPKVILASMGSLETGMSRILLASIAAHPASSIVVTSKGANKGTLTERILTASRGLQITIKHFERVPLVGDELDMFREEEREAAEAVAAEKAFTRLQRQREDRDSDEDEEDEAENEGALTSDSVGASAGGSSQQSSFTNSKGRAVADGAMQQPDGSMPSAGGGGPPTAASLAAARIEREQDMINSAAALKHVFWTDYRRDWYVDGASLTAQLPLLAPNSPFYPLPPPDALMDVNGVPVRHQVFPPKSGAGRAKRLIADAYGEAIDIDDFVIDSYSFSGPLSDDAMRTDGGSGPAGSGKAAPPLPADGFGPPLRPQAVTSTGGAVPAGQVPTKWIPVESQVKVVCGKKSIDFSAISDGRSLKTIYSRIQARKLVLVGGSPDATEYLYNHFKLNRASSSSQQQASSTAIEVLAPHLGETLIVSSAHNVVQAVLGEKLLAQLKISFVGEYELSWICATALGRRHAEADTMMCIDEGAKAEGGDASGTTPAGAFGRTASTMITIESEDTMQDATNPILVGNVRFGELRKALQKAVSGPIAFVDGDLIVGRGGERVAIRRDSQTGRLTIEGAISSDYYAIRRLLYSYNAAFLH